jgi:c-di-GMP-binding flagellar brake protein YcgR
MTEYSEKRKRPRAGGGFDLVLCTDETGPTKRVRVRDISSSGVSCHLDARVDEMTQVRIDLHIPQNGSLHQVSAEGAVVRCREIPENTPDEKYEIAIFFTGISDDGRKNIERYVTSRLKSV